MKKVLFNSAGSLLIEAIISITLISIFMSGVIFLLVENAQAIVSAQDHGLVQDITQESLDAIISMRNDNWCTIVSGKFRLSDQNGTWILGPTLGNPWAQAGHEVYRDDKTFYRNIFIEDVFRDGSNVIVESPAGSLDKSTKKITVRIGWAKAPENFDSYNNCGLETERDDVCHITESTTYLTRTGEPTADHGLLTYSDRVSYWGGYTDVNLHKMYDIRYDIWSDNVPSYNGSNNLLYSSPERDEIIGLSGEVANIFECERWASSEPMALGYNSSGRQTISGAYLNNGHFMVIYGRFITKFRVWDGMNWTSEMDLPTIPNAAGGVEQVIVKARPGSNEVMAAFKTASVGWPGTDCFDCETHTMYFDGSWNDGYSTSDWTLHDIHSGDSDWIVEDSIDFAWSGNNSSIGALVYSDGEGDTSININIWTANGSGGGSWDTSIEGVANAEAVGPKKLISHPTDDEFITCYQDLSDAPIIICITFDSSQTIIETAGINAPDPKNPGYWILFRAFDIAYEGLTGNNAILVSSDSLNTPSILRRYDSNTDTWDPLPVIMPTQVGDYPEKGFKLVPNMQNDDIMIFTSAEGEALQSVAWNGAANYLYTTRPGLSLINHNGAGQPHANWFDFTW